VAEHEWVGAANIPLDGDREARAALRHRSAVIADGMIVQVVEVMCASCRRAYGQAAGTECMVGAHLHGGDPDGKRKRRTRASDANPLIVAG
jgi:hypothetical protein